MEEYPKLVFIRINNVLFLLLLRSESDVLKYSYFKERFHHNSLTYKDVFQWAKVQHIAVDSEYKIKWDRSISYNFYNFILYRKAIKAFKYSC